MMTKRGEEAWEGNGEERGWAREIDKGDYGECGGGEGKLEAGRGTFP